METVDVSLLANQMTVTYDENKMDEGRIAAAVREIGYGASPQRSSEAKAEGFRGQWQDRKERAREEQEGMKRRLISSVLLLIPLMYIAMGEMMSLPVPGFLAGMENALVNACLLYTSVSATGGRYCGEERLLLSTISKVVADSRMVSPGTLFVPIIGAVSYTHLDVYKRQVMMATSSFEKRFIVTKDEEVDRLIQCQKNAKPVTKNLFSADAQIRSERALAKYFSRSKG